MAETLVKDQVCNACGSDIRPHSLFCYHCGGALQVGDFPNDGNEQDISDAWFRDDLTQEQSKEKQETKAAVNESSENDLIEADEEEVIEGEGGIKKPEEDLEAVLNEKKSAETLLDDDLETAKTEQAKVKSKPIEKTGFEKQKTEAKLMTASALRKRGTPSRLRMIEIQWEERENSPNIWFIIIALILVGLVGVLIWLSFYLK